MKTSSLLRRTALLALVVTTSGWVVAPAAPPSTTMRKSAVGTGGAVAAAHPLAVEAGLEMLRAGGNAVDAAAAAAFAVAVVEPFGSSIGGDGVAMIYDASSREMTGYAYRCMAPGKASRRALDARGESGWMNPFGTAVPGMVHGTVTFHAAHGRLSLQKVLEPAIRYAEEGFEIGPAIAGVITDSFEFLDRDPASAAIFLIDGLPPSPGDVLRNPDLAKSLRYISQHGIEGFYRGAIAQGIADYIQSRGGLLTREDFERYKTVTGRPLHSNYRGYDLYAPEPPFGGLASLLTINLIGASGFDPAKPMESPENLHFIAESMRLAARDRYAVSGDPAFVDVPSERLLDPAYATRRAKDILVDRALKQDEVVVGSFAGETATVDSPNDPGSTTHLSVVDGEGNAVSLTQTLGGYFGCGITVPGMGIVLNDQMKNFATSTTSPNSLQPGKRMNSTQSPTLVVKDGELVHVLGSPGNYRIVTTVALMVVRLLDYGLPVDEAINAPRLTAGRTAIVEMESRMPSASVARLRAMGHSVGVKGPMEMYFGGVHAISRDPGTGRLHAAADPRRDGAAGVLEPLTTEKAP